MNPEFVLVAQASFLCGFILMILLCIWNRVLLLVKQGTIRDRRQELACFLLVLMLIGLFSDMMIYIGAIQSFPSDLYQILFSIGASVALFAAGMGVHCIIGIETVFGRSKLTKRIM